MGSRNLKIATRLSIDFGLVTVSLIVVVALGLSNMRQIQDRMDEATKVNDVETRLTQTMELTVAYRKLPFSTQAV